MVNYIGVRCPACNKKFAASDDIVVCPICGAPHHRDCYASKNSCVFAAEHLSGKEWNPPAPEPPPQQPGPEAQGAAPLCPRCGATNPHDYVFCQVCGTALDRPPQQQQQQSFYAQPMWANYGAQIKVDPISLAYGGLKPDDEIGGESVRDLALYVGESSAYYLPRFKEIADGGRVITFNLSALVFNFLYFFHRKFYKIGVALMALYVISLVPQFFYAREMLPRILEGYGIASTLPFNEAAADHYLFVCRIAETIHLVIGFIVAFCANRFYLDKAIEDVKRIRESCADPQNRRQLDAALTAAGGTNKAIVFVVVGALLIGVFAATIAIMYSGGGFI